ncbi:hypothetical protein D3C72_933110 [compost metagenome]
MGSLRYSMMVAAVVAATMSPAFATDIEKRVQFKPGAYSTVITGTLDASKSPSQGEIRDRYIVRAKKGQTLKVTLTANSKVGLFGWHYDYNAEPLLNAQGTKVTQTAKFPANGDYHIDVDLMESKPVIQYKLTIEIR